MSAFYHQFFHSRRHLGVLALLCLGVASGNTLAGETAVERSGNGVDLIQDSTDEGDARSSEASAAAEELVEAVPAHPHDVPLADAVSTAAGSRQDCIHDTSNQDSNGCIQLCSTAIKSFAFHNCAQAASTAMMSRHG